MIRLADLVDVEHVRVLDRGLKPALAAKALDELGVVGELGPQDLERDTTVERGLDGLVDDAHSTASDHPQDAVPRDAGASLDHSLRSTS